MANIAIINYCNLRCPFCLDGDTNILMADGSSKKIKDISKGDVVIGFQEFVEKNKQRQISPTTVSSDLMIHTESDYYKITLDNGLSLKITGNHPVLTSSNEWIKVEDLKEKVQQLQTIEHLIFQNITIASIEHIKEPLEVYNFETESHTYVANGIAVHNCFADDMIQEETQVISIEDYQKMLFFLAKTPHNHVGIIGGEPTLHPRLEEILKETNKYCRECNTDATLFTNGIELEKFLPYFGERIHLLINYTNPDDMTAEQRKKRTHCLDQLFDLCWFDQKASCGINIHPGCVDYSWFWEMVDRYHLNHVRCSVVSPAAKYECWRSDKEGYYTMMKPVFIDFCRQAIQHNCRLGMDCGHIPTCYFTAEEKEIVYSICDNVDQDWCEPVVDIKPDFKATACFGSYDPIDIRDFDNLFELERYLSRKKSLPRAELNCTGRCSTCKKHKLLQCQGGCLGFAEVL